MGFRNGSPGLSGPAGGETLAETLAIGADANAVPITGLSSLDGAGLVTLGGATALGITVGRAGQTTRLEGNLVGTGITVSIDSENVQTRDNHIYINKDYVTAAGQTGGIAHNFLPTATVDTEAAGGFTGVTTVATTGAAVFPAGAIVQVSGAANPANDGVYEVASHAGNVLTIQGGPTHRFCNTAFVVDATGSAAAFTQVTVTLLQAKTDGVWQIGKGATEAAITADFADVATGTATLTNVLAAGNTTGANDIIVTTGQSILGAAELTITSGTGDDNLTLSSGNNLAGDSGDVSIDAGPATGTPGSLLLGTVNADAVTIGKGGTTVTFEGGANDATIRNGTGTFNSVEIGDNDRYNMGAPDAFFAWSTAQTTANNLILALNATGAAAGGGTLILTTIPNGTKNHDLPVSSTPQLALFSQTDPDVDNTQNLILSHDTTNARVEWGSGDLSLGATGGGQTVRFEGLTDFTVLDGNIGGSTANFVIVNASSAVDIADNGRFILGNANDSELRWSTAQTNDSLMWGIQGGSASQSAALILFEETHAGSDFLFPVATDPTLVVFSRTGPGVATDEFVAMKHNVTSAELHAGSGGFVLSDGGDGVGDATLACGAITAPAANVFGATGVATTFPAGGNEAKIVDGTFRASASCSGLFIDAYLTAAAALARDVTSRVFVTGGSVDGVRISAGHEFAWSSNAEGAGDAFGNLDTFIGRGGAGVTRFGATTASSDGTIQLATVNAATIDTVSAGALVIAPATATALTLGATDIDTTVRGGLIGGAATGATDDGDLRFGNGTSTMLYDASAFQLKLLADSVDDSGVSDRIFISGNSNTVFNMRVAGNSSGAGLFSVSSSRGTLAAPTAQTDGQDLLVLQALLYDGTTFETCAAIRMLVDGTVGATSSPGLIEFRTTPDGSNGTLVRWRINNAGSLVGGLENTTVLVQGVDSVTNTVAGAGITVRGGAGKTSSDGGDLLLAGGTSPSGSAGTVTLAESGQSIGFYGTTPAAQSSAYTRDAAIVEARTLLASASATVLNNNNVIAAIVADLQAVGLLG